MNESINTRARDLRKYKRIAIVAVLSVGLIAAVGVSAAAYGIYRVAGATLTAVEGSLAKTDAPGAAGLDRYAIDMVDGWMANALREGNTASLNAGLQCLASIGGPSPERSLEALSARMGDSATGKEARRALEELRGASKSETSGAPQAGACLRLVTS